jgi:acetoin utilization protein AcuC
MSVALAYSDELAAYDLGPDHPLRPERFTLAVELMRAYRLIREGEQARVGTARLVAPREATREDLELVHDAAYIDTVIRASTDPAAFSPARGLGPGDTPPAHGLHRAAALVCGATTAALRAVVEGDMRRSFSVAGGLHHAHRDRAAGFCVYNDPAVAIEVMRRDHPGIRVAYIDIDAHHGDGVQEAFYATPDVLTISIHESGRYLFPGTGRFVETGTGAGDGFAINVPLAPLSDDTAYRMVARDVIAPAVRVFCPDVIVAQCGADAHHADPLTHLGLTLPGYRTLIERIVELADEVCAGAICCTGGGGYGSYSVVPRAWTLLLASLLGVSPAGELPDSWREHSAALSGEPAPLTLTADEYQPLPAVSERVHVETAALVERVRAASSLLAGV